MLWVTSWPFASRLFGAGTNMAARRVYRGLNQDLRQVVRTLRTRALCATIADRDNLEIKRAPSKSADRTAAMIPRARNLSVVRRSSRKSFLGFQGNFAYRTWSLAERWEHVSGEGLFYSGPLI